MSYQFDTRLGQQLYQLMPELYRTRDRLAGQGGGAAGSDDLARYLDAHGRLLDLIHATLEQQLRDALPESSQDWLLPYFAQLLAVNIVSPESDGRHAEIDHAISWRQRKGTLKCAEEIAEAIGQVEVEIQEGWKRVARTPRIGMPIIPAEAWDDTLEIETLEKETLDKDAIYPAQAARHPGLPAVMVDLRQASRAVRALPTNPAARISAFGGIKCDWRQANHHGAPCFPDSFDDVSRRTLDLRAPGAANGHHHHKRLLAYAPPPAGLFGYAPLVRPWVTALEENLIETRQESGVTIYANNTRRTLVVYSVLADTPNDRITLDPGVSYRIDDIHFCGTLFLASGRLELNRVEAQIVKVDSSSTDVAALTASDCLFGELSVGSGLAELDSCTVRGMAFLRTVNARDCIVMQVSDETMTGALQYCRLPEAIVTTPLERRELKRCVADEPDFFDLDGGLAADSVLTPNAPRSIYAGAGDGGEMGYYHNGRKNRPVELHGDCELSPPPDGGYPLSDVIFRDRLTVSGGTLEIRRSAVSRLDLTAPLAVDVEAGVTPGLIAIECLFDRLVVDDNLARLEYCSVMQEFDGRYLQASDCIFVGAITSIQDPPVESDRPPFLNCVRYSCLPGNLDDDIARALGIKDAADRPRLGSNTLETPVFIRFGHCDDDEPSAQQGFGRRGYGVLSIDSPDEIRFGAEDGSEMGAYHHKYYSLKWEAVLDKMREFLPVGIEPVLIQDARLLELPPEHEAAQS